MFETRYNSNKSSLLLPVNSTEFAFNPLEALTYWISDVMLTCLTSSVNNFFIYMYLPSFDFFPFELRDQVSHPPTLIR